MATQALTRNLADLAQKINAAHRACEGVFRDSLSYAVEAGNLLSEAKAICRHGEWIPWLEEYFEGSRRTASGYMRVSQRISANGQRVAHLPLRGVLKELASEKKTKKKQEKAERKAARPKLDGEKCTLIVADIADAGKHIKAESVDWVITDPPYPKEYLDAYDHLAAVAHHALKPGGSLIAMVGQSYMPTILAKLSEWLSYQWTLAYLTPGGQASQLWERKVNTFWKPLLWFVKGKYDGDWIGDVCRSDVNDNDKRFHGWGQSESGMADIIERFTDPGQTILDPFLGGGTTGVVAVRMRRRFIGIDVDADTVATAEGRIAEVMDA